MKTIKNRLYVSLVFLLTVMGKVNYKEQFELGLGVTNNDYLSASLLIMGYNQLDLGIGYEFSQRKGLSSLRENTMEFVLRYRFINSTQIEKKEALKEQHVKEVI